MAGIYLVEDDPSTLRLLQLIMESQQYVIVGTATNTPDAKTGIWATRPDLCIIDISLEHGTSGIEVAEFVIEKIGCPLIVMSADDQPTLPVPFLLKPISPRRLIDTVEHLLHGTVAANSL
jgi:DNA-binding NtrC family response regulator